MSINRRIFIKQTVMAGGAVLATSIFPDFVFAEEAIDALTILHTNDVHSRLEPFPMDGSNHAGLGGVAPRSRLISQIKKEEKNVLLLDAGDMFQGTPYFNIYKGEPEIKAMNMMQYDAGTIGNHDFDGGLENLASQLSHATFAMVNCNYNFDRTPLEGKVVPYTIIQKENIKIGILGVGIELKGLVPDNLYGNIIYNNPIQKANETADLLNKKGCDMIICLSHLGDKYFDNKVSDEILAKECYDIDLIIGGHTHRFFNKPLVYNNRSKGNTVVNQVGWAGIQLGRLDYNFTRMKKKNLVRSHTVMIREKTSE